MAGRFLRGFDFFFVLFSVNQYPRHCHTLPLNMTLLFVELSNYPRFSCVLLVSKKPSRASDDYNRSLCLQLTRPGQNIPPQNCPSTQLSQAPIPRPITTFFHPSAVRRRCPPRRWPTNLILPRAAICRRRSAVSRSADHPPCKVTRIRLFQLSEGERRESRTQRGVGRRALPRWASRP